MNSDNNNVLADTTIWIEYLRGSSNASAILESLIIGKRVWICGPVVFELLQGVRSPKQKEAVKNALNGLPYAEMSGVLWEKAAESYVSLRKNGLTVPLSDLFIAVIAIEHDLSVFTHDKHFEQIPGVKLYQP
ncbi:MAG: PIN domain-containing protein [Nitrospirota bacterium]